MFKFHAVVWLVAVAGFIITGILGAIGVRVAEKRSVRAEKTVLALVLLTLIAIAFAAFNVERTLDLNDEIHVFNEQTIVIEILGNNGVYVHEFESDDRVVVEVDGCVAVYRYAVHRNVGRNGEEGDDYPLVPETGVVRSGTCPDTQSALDQLFIARVHE